MIYAKVLLKTVNNLGFVATTFELQFPRIIIPEVLTHRSFSRNTASHRAQPFNTVLKQVQDNPFIPYYWQKEHKGMQGKEYFTYTEPLVNAWLNAGFISFREHPWRNLRGWWEADLWAINTDYDKYDDAFNGQTLITQQGLKYMRKEGDSNP